MGNVLAAVEDEEVVEPECPDVISVEVSPKKKVRCGVCGVCVV